MQHCRRQAAIRSSLLPLTIILAAGSPVAVGQTVESRPEACRAASASGVLWPAAGEALRVGGDLFGLVTREGENFRCGDALIDTPLPDGYPGPTPPGAIEIKSYPTVRRAEVSGGTNPDLGQSSAFWPLFQHIKKHDIAMTSPVEMDYTSLDRNQAAPRETDWTMSFLYRSSEMNATGKEGSVVVKDLPPVTMLAIGYTGSYSVGKAQLEVEKLYQWLDSHPEYRAIGSPRAMYYNGPNTLPANRWAEVQLPVERTEGPADAAAAESQ